MESRHWKEIDNIDEYMTAKLAVRNSPTRPRLARRNTMAFPRGLREAIPDLHTGRVLELDSISGEASNQIWSGPIVEMKMLLKETGELKGEFVVRMELQIEAARQLAATLVQLADKAERLAPFDLPRQ